MKAVTELIFFCKFFAIVQSTWHGNIVENYIDLAKVYFQFRHVSILTHFDCFSTSECFLIIIYYLKKKKSSFILHSLLFTDINAQIETKLSNSSFQSRFVTNFNKIERLIDTPPHSNEGYIVDVACEHFLRIFEQVG